jgi:isoleucyl-tRNA synthetase
MISAASSLRMKSKLKRRWPVEEIIFISDKAKDLTEEEVTILEDLMNTKKLKKTSDMNIAPLRFNLRPNLQVLGKKLKGKLPQLLLFLEKEDKNKLARRLMTEKEILLSFDETETLVKESDFKFLMEPEEGYAYLDVEGDKLFMKISRNPNLIKEGILRDIARRIQAYRKELGLNPAQIVKLVEISSDDNEITGTIREKGEELRFLVRADRIDVREGLPEKWKSEEIDEKTLKINIMP